MKKSFSKSGRLLIELDGYSIYHRADISGALTGIVSLPPEYAAKTDEELREIAGLCLDRSYVDCKRRFGAKVVRKAGHIR